MGSGAAWAMVAVAAAAGSVMEAAATAGLGTVQATGSVDTVAAAATAAAATVVDMVVVDMAAGAMVEAAITDRTDRSARRRGSTVMTRASALVCAAAFACLVSGCASHRKRADVDQPRQVCEATMIGSQPKTVCY
jgi:hypothetical protein